MHKFRSWLESNASVLVEVVVHVIAWGLYLAFYQLSYLRPVPGESYRWLYLFTIVVTDVPLFYYLYLRAIPRLLAGKRAGYFVLIVVGFLVAYPLLRYGVDQLFLYNFPEQVSPLTTVSNTQFWFVFVVRLLAAALVIVMAGVGKFTFDWFRNMRIQRELENQNLTSELAFLKSQINPHFLFNTLNNIHTLAYKKADETPEVVMKLSDLMRYMIYESDVDLVPLEKEINHLKNFIDLQELRFKANGIADVKIYGSVADRSIAPLLLLPFVENAFKHGYGIDRPGAISIEIWTGECIRFSIENPLPPNEALVQKDKAGGIGLENIRRRLALIYPDRYTLHVHQSSSNFKAELEIHVNV